MAWTAFFIIGGGFAVSEAAQVKVVQNFLHDCHDFLANRSNQILVCVKVSGLASWLGAQLESLQGLEPGVVSLLCSLLVSALTQVTSNLATVSLTQPILLALVRIT